MDPSLLDHSRADRLFSNAQETTQCVRAAAQERPACCGRTSFTLRCGHTEERVYSLQLPVKTTRPNESVERPFQNRHYWVTPIAADHLPVLQVISACDDIEGVDYVTVAAAGPPECPPGTVNRLTVTGGPAASTRDIPFTAWQLFTPSGLAAGTFQTLTASLLTNLHPLKLPDLPPRVSTLSVAGCLAGGPGTALRASVHAFPDVRWKGDYTLRLTPSPGAGHTLSVEGELAVTWNGGRSATGEWNVLKPLLKWHGLAEELGRMASAVRALCEDDALSGYDSSRLQRLGSFRWNPAPSVRVHLSSRLFEQRDNGLIGHEAKLEIASDPGADGEHNVLPFLASLAANRPLLAPLRAAVPGDRLDDLCVRYGIYLVAEGQARFRIAAAGRRPVEPWKSKHLAADALTLHLEGRSECEFETVIVEASGDDDPALPPALYFECEPPPRTGMEVRIEDFKFRAAAHLTGLAVRRVLTSAAGVLTLTTPPAEPRPPARLLPPRSWPPKAKPGETPEVEWC